MKEITQAELFKEYGLNLPRGKYDIVLNGDKYEIHEVRDDTSGCILVGENKVKGGLVNSRFYERELTSWLKMWQKQGEELWISIV